MKPCNCQYKYYNGVKINSSFLKKENMKFTSINSLINITDDDILEKINKGETRLDLNISAHVEESHTRYITLNIARDTTSDKEFDIYLDIDIYQAELFARKLQSLVDERKLFLESNLNN